MAASWTAPTTSDSGKDIQAGKVSHVYALNLSRIGRSLPELVAFEALCRHHDTALRPREGPREHDHGHRARMLYAILASIAQFMRELAEEAQAATLEERRERKDVLGYPNYGMRLVWSGERFAEERDPAIDVDVLRTAFLDAGSAAGAVRLLNERGIPSRRGKSWGLSAFRRALAYHFPDLLTASPRSRGQRQVVAWSFRRSSAAPCGGTLTPNAARGQYYCHRSRTHTGHGKAAIKEAKLLPWVREQAARLRIPVEMVTLADERAKSAPS